MVIAAEEGLVKLNSNSGLVCVYFALMSLRKMWICLFYLHQLNSRVDWVFSHFKRRKNLNSKQCRKQQETTPSSNNSWQFIHFKRRGICGKLSWPTSWRHIIKNFFYYFKNVSLEQMFNHLACFFLVYILLREGRGFV